MIIKKQSRLRGILSVPGDNSISHSAVMLGSLARGTTQIMNFLDGEDCLSTIACFRSMGIGIDADGPSVTVRGKGLHGLSEPSGNLHAGNSGTTTRLISGILAGQDFRSVIEGDASLSKRPMKRIMDPLRQMGARITDSDGMGHLPLTIWGGKLKGIDYCSPVASAQVKSCVLLAGLYAEGDTSVTEPVLSRDHTERMLRSFGARVESTGAKAAVRPDPVLTGRQILVPGDISTAAYYIAAALITPGSEILLKNVGINPTRDGMLRVCRAMGADITMENIRDDGEPAADLLVKSSSLHGTVIEGELIPSLIDEIPILAVLAAFAEGTTVIRDAAELKVKESDRIASVTAALRAMGSDTEPTKDGMVIHGGRPLHGGIVDSCKDHRVAMSFAVAGTVCEGDVDIKDADCVRISCPGFYRDLYGLGTA